jgi:hypothetical protein
MNQMIYKTIAEKNYTDPQASVDVCGAVTHHRSCSAIERFASSSWAMPAKQAKLASSLSVTPSNVEG